MSKKIEINTLITKHENKCKGCRFDMIDVEDPLWEYGSPLKRVLIDNLTGETYDVKSVSSEYSFFDYYVICNTYYIMGRVMIW